MLAKALRFVLVITGCLAAWLTPRLFQGGEGDRLREGAPAGLFRALSAGILGREPRLPAEAPPDEGGELAFFESEEGIQEAGQVDRAQCTSKPARRGRPSTAKNLKSEE